MGHNEKHDIRKLRQPIRVRDGIIRNKMLDFLLVSRHPFVDIMRIWPRGKLQLTHGVKALEESNQQSFPRPIHQS